MKYFTTFLIATFFASVGTIFGNHRDSVDVFHYNIHIKITDFQGKNIWGETTIRFIPRQTNSSTFAFDLERLTIDSLLLNGQSMAFVRTQSLFRFFTNETYSPDDTLDLTVYYHGVPVTDASGWGGFYFSGQQAFNMGVGMSANPHAFGRVWFPCNDSFTDKATYDIWVTTLANHKATCGGMLIQEENLGNNLKRWHWSIEQPVCTYVVSVAVGDFQKIEFSHQGQQQTIPIWIYAPSGMVDQATSAFSAVTDMLSAFENYFGPHPFPRVGYTVVDFSSGAMEHVMNIGYPSNAVSSSQSNRILMAHELSHMWFGDFITCATAEDMWLNEGWATFCESMYLEHTEGVQIAHNYRYNNHRYVLKQAHISDGGFLPLYGIGHQNTYGTTVYKKGADVVRTLRTYLGDSAFFSSLRAWFMLNPFSSKTTAEFCEFLSQQNQINLQPFFDTWVYNSGFPHYSLRVFEPLQNGANITLGQLRYGGQYIGNKNRVPVTFFADRNQYQTIVIEFDGASSSQHVTLPFYPQMAIVDYFMNVSDATIKTEKKITSSLYTFSDQSLTVYPQTTTDSAWFYVVYNMVRPAERGQIFDGIEVSHHYYWTIHTIPYGNFRGKARFIHSTVQNPADTVWSPQSNDRLEMLYRRWPQNPWRKLSIQNNLTPTGGYAILDSIMPGEYAFGLWRYDVTGINSTGGNTELMIYPNPANHQIFIQINNDVNYEKIFITDLNGRIVQSLEQKAFPLIIDISMLRDGIYNLHVEENNTPSIVKRFVKLNQSISQ